MIDIFQGYGFDLLNMNKKEIENQIKSVNRQDWKNNKKFKKYIKETKTKKQTVELKCKPKLTTRIWGYIKKRALLILFWAIIWLLFFLGCYTIPGCPDVLIAIPLSAMAIPLSTYLT